MSHERRDEREERAQLDCIERKIGHLHEEIEFLEGKIDYVIATLKSKILSQGQVNLMAKSIVVGGTSLATLALKDQNGASMTIDATYGVAYSASNPSNVSIAKPNPDGSATITGVAVDPGDVIGCVVTLPDMKTTVTLTTDTLTITASTVQTLTSGAVVLT